MRRPDFFIVGAPKCGTTSLAQWLSAHPEIYMSPWKEPHFFSTDHVEPTRPLPKEYALLFDKANARHKAVGEASTWYLFSREAIPSILKAEPNARFVICVRNPVDMAYSLHNQSVFAGTESLRNFEEAWGAQGDRANGRRLPGGGEPSRLQYGAACKLGEQVARAIQLAGPDAVHVLFLEDMQDDPTTANRSVLRFLGVAEDFVPEFHVANEAGKRRSPVLRRLVRKTGAAKRALGIRTGLGLLQRLDSWNRQPGGWTPSEAMSAELRAYFEEDVQLLAQVTKRDLSHWLRPTASGGRS